MRAYTEKVGVFDNKIVCVYLCNGDVCGEPACKRCAIDVILQSNFEEQQT